MSEPTNGDNPQPKTPCAFNKHRVFIAIPVGVFLDLIKTFSLCVECGARCAVLEAHTTDLSNVPGTEKPQ